MPTEEAAFSDRAVAVATEPSLASSDRSGASPARSSSDPISTFIENCRRKLVDTSMRSRLLNYTSGKRSRSLEIVGEHPVAIWNAIVAARRAMILNHAVEHAAVAERRSDSDDELNATSNEHAPAIDPATKPAATSVDVSQDAFAEEVAFPAEDRHQDEFLDTRLDAAQLAITARRLDDTARLTREEQGVETLFLAIGFVCYFEAESSDKQRRAPLLLIPASLERDRGDRWKVRARDEDPLVNPALREYLRTQHGLTLPPLPEPIDGFDPLEWFNSVRELVVSRPRWTISASCTLGIFSFQKFVMHEDLKRNHGLLASHPVVAQLATRSGCGDGTVQLPDDVGEMRLDRDLPPEQTLHVLDADSTQLRALAAAGRGHNLVVEGPPGTGKSQTIANLIAHALGAGKTVLFVAEKQAALNVVHERMKKAGLGSACLELHSAKASKAAVVNELRRTLDATLLAGEARESPSTRLAQAREGLTQYAEAVHQKIEPLGRTVFSAIGRLSALRDAPEMRMPLDVKSATAADVDDASRKLSSISKVVARIGDPGEHPWRDRPAAHLDRDALSEIKDLLGQLGRSTGEAARSLDEVVDQCGMTAEWTLEQASKFGPIADVIESSPGVEAQIAARADWCRVPEEVRRLLDAARGLTDIESRLRKEFVVEQIDDDLESAARSVASSRGGALAWISPKWRAARARLKQAIKADQWRGTASAATSVCDGARARALRGEIAASAVGSSRFGARWKGADSDWSELEQLTEWLTRFRHSNETAHFGPQVMALVARRHPRVEAMRKLVAASTRAVEQWRQLVQVAGWKPGYGGGLTVHAVAKRVRDLDANLDGWRDWNTFAEGLSLVAVTIGASAIEEARAGRLRWSDLACAFERRFYDRWLDECVSRSDVLRRFTGLAHEELVSEFRRLDARTFEDHGRALAATLRGQAQARLRDPGIERDQRFLRDQLARQRGHKPVRQLLHHACGAVRAIKPCFLMSPATVALCLDPERHRFDMVIFDEASQMTPEDALGTIVRGRQVIVVGDPKQLPPTNFFGVQSGQVDAEESADGEPVYSDLQSVLELALASGFAGTRLRWHYRSRHESLIAFSNRRFYDSSLFTFPSVDTDTSKRGLSFVCLPDGCYEGKGINRVEARRVVDAVVEHARRCPTKSLGVGTFSLAQQIAIQDEVEKRRREDSLLDEFLSLDKREPFFVKSLESIQGDERDVVILSITYGRNVDGRILNRFGPINGENGWRRLNVLTTRARERMVVFSSMRAEDISVNGAQSKGAELLRSFLRFAETGELKGDPVVDATAETESPFEAEVMAELERAGIRVQPQVGVAGYRIDLGVIDPERPGRFVCGIECDGVAYHSSESARDRDRLREHVLKGLGWRLHRVWSLDWWHDRSTQTKRLIDLIARSMAEEKSAPDVESVGANAPTSPPRASDLHASAAKEPASAPVSSRRERQAVPFDAYASWAPTLQPSDLLVVTDDAIAKLCVEVLVAEGPLHEDDLRARVLASFGRSRAGTRLSAKIASGLASLRGRDGIETDGFSWRVTTKEVRPRQRAGTAIPADRIPSWEVDRAVIAILEQHGSRTDGELIDAVRDSFGFGGAGAGLRTAVEQACSRLSAAGRLGLGSGGVALLEGAMPSS